MTQLLKDLLEILDRVEERWGKKWYEQVYPCGLIPVRDGSPEYSSTPKNTITIVSTGGNGVHFGIITDYENLAGFRPVVMTVPMMATNVIIAETLEEFLGIGYYNGWSALEELVYDFDWTIEYYSGNDDSKDIMDKRFLEFARKELKIEFAPLTRERLELLDLKYRPQLRVDQSSLPWL